MSVVVWFIALPAVRKSTLARKVQAALATERAPTCLLDSDEVRNALVPQPGYGPQERDDFYATLANLASLLAWQGVVVLVAATASQRLFRECGREVAPQFLEVHVSTPIDECKHRDTKGLFTRAEAGVLMNVPGVDEAYEAPSNPDVIDRGHAARESVDKIVSKVQYALARVPSARWEGAGHRGPQSYASR